MSSDLLNLSNVSCGYNDLPVLLDIDITVRRGESVFVLGPNGAGKSTLLKTIAGEIKPLRGAIEYCGEKIVSRPSRRARLGIVHVPEGRGMFPELTVAENLRLAESLSRRRIFAKGEPPSAEISWEEGLRHFPEIIDRADEPAGLLSGGQQQMLALARAIVSRPELLLLDEPSMGLAPLAVARVEEVMLELRERGQTVLLVEQNAELALRVGSRGYVLEGGRIQFSGESAAFREEGRLMATYFGQAESVKESG
jgi:branched-chain amino acid transport system ATP-binding protein